MNSRSVVAVLLCLTAALAVYRGDWLLAFFLAWMAAELVEEEDKT